MANDMTKRFKRGDLVRVQGNSKYTNDLFDWVEGWNPRRWGHVGVVTDDMGNGYRVCFNVDLEEYGESGIPVNKKYGFEYADENVKSAGNFKVGDEVFAPIIPSSKYKIGTIKKINEGFFGGTKNYVITFNFDDIPDMVYLGSELRFAVPELEEMTEHKEEETFKMEKLAEEPVRTAINPAHYDIHEGYQVIDLMRETSTKEELEGFFRNNALKYILRYKQKNGVEDIKKARYYINALIDLLEE